MGLIRSFSRETGAAREQKSRVWRVREDGCLQGKRPRENQQLTNPHELAGKHHLDLPQLANTDREPHENW